MYLEYATTPQFKIFYIKVSDIDSLLSNTEVAKKSILSLSDSLFKTLKLQSKLPEIGIDDKNFKVMADKACRGGNLSLTANDIEKLYYKCT